MRRIRTLMLSAALLLVFAASAHAQFAPWPNPLPRLPNWGDYDAGHVWHNASWWWENQADWARSNHPEWWGDFDEGHSWHPAWWWWQQRAAWTRAHHPEWWGDSYQNNWYPAQWWWENQPAWAQLNHPD